MTEASIQYNVKAGEFEFSFTEQQIRSLDFIYKSPTEFNLIKEHRSVNTKLLEADTAGKKLKIEVEGEFFEVQIKDELDQVLDKMGFGKISGKKIKEVKAPMPGLVLEIAVSEGQQVKEGEKVLILVAMKMENSLLIHADATIKTIAVSAGQAVEKGQLLIELE